MDISLAQSVELKCPACGKSFSAGIWLVVDGSARPDLIERARAGRLQGVPRQMLQVVLAADPDAALQEMEAEAARQLERLREEDPEAFAELEASAREAREQEPLLGTIQAFIQAKTWTESQDIVAAHPELLGDEADEILGRLVEGAESRGDENAARAFREHRDLLRRCREEGIETAFAEEMAPDVPAAVKPLLEELSQPSSITDMPRRIEVCRRALDLLSRTEHTHLWAAIQSELGNSLAQNPLGDRAQNIEDAIDHCQQALDVFKIHLHPDDHRRVQRSLSRLTLDQHRWADARKAAQAAIDAGNLLYNLAAMPGDRQSELQKTRGLAGVLAYALCQRPDTAAEQLQEAVVALEENRARWLSEALALQTARPPDVPDEVWDSFAVQRNLVGELLAEARLPDDTPARRDDSTLTRAMHEAQECPDEMREQVRAHAPDFLPKAIFADVREAASDTPLVYLTTTEVGGLALLVTGSQITPVQLGELTTAAIEKRSQTWPDLYDETALGWMRDAALKNLIEALQDHGLHRVVLIPTGRLSLLPLHAALPDDIAVSYAPNARALRVARERAGRLASTLLDLFAVDDPLSNLEHSEAEVNAVASHFENPWLARGSRATWNTVLQGMRECNLCHFSCHGYFSPEESLDSGLELKWGQRLKLRDILAEHLSDKRLALRSACQTNLPDPRAIDEVINLPSAFLQAGFAGVVGTLWSVGEESTFALAKRFYESWLDEGLDPPEALHEAQMWMKTKTKWSRPYYWAGFTYTGV